MRWRRTTCSKSEYFKRTISPADCGFRPRGSSFFANRASGRGRLEPQAAAEAIRAKLAKDYLVNPQVTVTVFDYGKRRFAVLGEVQKAGTYDMPEREKITLLDAIAMAGGYTRIADPSKVTLKRKDGGKERIIRLNAKTMAKDDRIASFEIQPGDVITIGESLF